MNEATTTDCPPLYTVTRKGRNSAHISCNHGNNTHVLHLHNPHSLTEEEMRERKVAEFFYCETCSAVMSLKKAGFHCCCACPNCFRWGYPCLNCCPRDCRACERGLATCRRCSRPWPKKYAAELEEYTREEEERLRHAAEEEERMKRALWQRRQLSGAGPW